MNVASEADDSSIEPLGCDSIKRRCPHDGISIGARALVGLIIRDAKKDVGPVRNRSHAEDQQEESDENSHQG